VRACAEDAGPCSRTPAVRTLVLGLGNDLLADDAVGLLVARALRERLGELDRVDVRETSVHGLALLELLVGYERAILVDAVHAGRHPPGSVIGIDPSELSEVYAPSPHYAGLPEMFALARALELDFPTDVAIIAIEVADVGTIGGPMTAAVREAVPEACRRIESRLATGPAALTGRT